MRVSRSFVSLLVLGSVLGMLSCKSGTQKLGEQVVAKVEEFRQTHGKLPESLDEIGIQVKSESDPPVYYRKESNDHYIVWYGLSLGESMVYDSQTKKWEEHS
jgi:hypothetical protein